MTIQDPHSFCDTQQGRICHVDFEFEVDFACRTLSGTGVYHLENPAKGSLFLDTRGLHVKRVFAGNAELKWSLDQDDEVKGTRLHISNPDGLNRIGIEFSTAPTASALGWLDPPQTAGGKYPFMLSQCQAIHARSMIPCQDSPSVRFTYTAKVKVAAPLTAVMSAERTDVRREGDFNICQFRMPQAIPSYLFALAVGHIASERVGKRCTVFAEPEMLAAAAWEFAETDKLIEEAEKLFGPYLWETFDLLVLPPSFPYGGMENPRLTFLTPTLVVGDRSMVNVVAHELAHSWTGNLVTNATWEDFWLNEGWTVFAERRIQEVTEGVECAQLHAAVRRKSMLEDMHQFGMESTPTRLKFSQQGIDPDEVFSTIPYEKGCSFLARVEKYTGRERFDQFIRDYIQTFQFKSLTTDDFLAFLRKSFPDIDKHIDIKKWVFEPGFPSDALEPSSPLLDRIYECVKNYQETGTLPTSQEVASWVPSQVEVFLKAMPKQIPAKDCAALRELLGLEKSRNNNHLAEYFVIAIRSGFEPVLPQVEQMVSRVGRMLYLKPVYRALAETPWSKPHAERLFSTYRHAYHPIAVSALERVLAG